MSEIDLDQGLELLRQMIRIRRFEEKSAEVYGAGKIRGFLHLYVGEEAIAAGAIPVLQDQDVIFSTYREHGHALVRGVPMSAIMAEMYGKSTGCSRGRGGSMHLFDASRNFYGGNAIVGGGIPLAVGMALADRMLGRSKISVCFFGDGAAAEGVFHESLNLAALWNLPVLFLCENNRYAMGTALERAHAQTRLATKAESHTVRSEQVDGMDVLAVRDAVERAAASVRTSRKPYFLELLTYRFRAHSMYDPDLYRSKSEVAEWKKRDPITLFEKVLRDRKLIDDSDRDLMLREVEAELAAAIEFAESSPREPIGDLLKDVCTPSKQKEARTREPAA